MAQRRKGNVKYGNPLRLSLLLPVIGPGRVPYAISISLSTSRMKQVGEKNLLKPLRETAEAISRELGFNVREQA